MTLTTDTPELAPENGSAAFDELSEATRDMVIAIAATTEPLAQLRALKSAAKRMAIPVRHGGIDKQEAADALYEQAGNCGLIAEFGETTIITAIGTGLEDFSPPPVNGAVIEEAPFPASPAEYGVLAPPAAGLSAERFKPIPIDAVQVSKDPAWLVTGILPARGLAAVVGAPKCGKSYLTTDMLLTAARGAPYAGRATLSGPVFYLTGEGVNGFKRRLVAMRQHYGIEGEGVPFFMIENVPDLGSERTDLEQLLRTLEQYLADCDLPPPRAIVLDTLARCMGDGDESSARDMGRFVTRCGEIERKFGCLVVVVHHMGKNPAAGARGSNALNGAADVTLTVEKGDAYSTVRIDEMKDGAEGAEWRFRLVSAPLDRNLLTPSETMPEVSACTVDLLSEPTLSKPAETKTTRPPKGLAGDLLKVLRRAIEEAGERNIAGGQAPNNVRAVSRTALKNYCETMDWQDARGKPDAFRSDLSKYLSTLRAAELIGFDRDHVWLA